MLAIMLESIARTLTSLIPVFAVSRRVLLSANLVRFYGRETQADVESIARSSRQAYGFPSDTPNSDVEIKLLQIDCIQSTCCRPTKALFLVNCISHCNALCPAKCHVSVQFRTPFVDRTLASCKL